MAAIKRPRKGSLAFYPKKRAKRIYPELSVYPETEKPKVLAFAGYKAGMTHSTVLDNKKGSPTFGQEIFIPVTVLDCPSLKAVGLRAYGSTVKGLRVLDEYWIKELPKGIEKKVKIKPKEEKLSEIEKSLNRVSNIRLIISTQPKLSGIGKKKPEIFEVGVGGKNVKEKLEFVKQLLGKEIKPNDVVKEGELVDIIAITKGKGTAGPVKRFGVKIQVRHAKKKLRHVGSLGQERPGKVRHTVAMAGQLGLQRRTELNKRILKIGEKGEEITPKSGFKRYGIVKGSYVVVEGSVPGAKKRLVMLRPAIRPWKAKLIVPEVREIVK